MTQPSTFKFFKQTMYDGSVLDFSDWVISGGLIIAYDMLSTVTFRAAGYRATDGKMRGAKKGEFQITLRYDPVLDRQFDPLVGNPTGFLYQEFAGNGSAPQQGDDWAYMTATIFKRHYTGNANSTNIEQVVLDYKPTDSTTAVAPTFTKY